MLKPEISQRMLPPSFPLQPNLTKVSTLNLRIPFIHGSRYTNAKRKFRVYNSDKILSYSPINRAFEERCIKYMCTPFIYATDLYIHTYIVHIYLYVYIFIFVCKNERRGAICVNFEKQDGERNNAGRKPLQSSAK